MDALLEKATADQVKVFYGIDRELYTVLVRDLCRNPLECLQIMGLWLWLERLGIGNVISKILAHSQYQINRLADEAVACLKSINSGAVSLSQVSEIPLTRCLVERNVCLKHFQENQAMILKEVQTLVTDVYIPALSDIVHTARHFGSSGRQAVRNPGSVASSSQPLRQARALLPPPPPLPMQHQLHPPPQPPTWPQLQLPPPPRPRPQPQPQSRPQLPPPPPPRPQPRPRPLLQLPPPPRPPAQPQLQLQPQARPSYEDPLALNFSALRIQEGTSAAGPSRNRGRGYDNTEYTRTMFATFSKGYPVTEGEVRRFFTALFGNCIAALHMQDVRPGEQPLYARIVFVDPSYITRILDGDSKAKFTINGKHVWMRRFVPRNGRGPHGGARNGAGPSHCTHYSQY